MRASAEWLEWRQVPLYLGALIFATLVGVLVPTAAGPAEAIITPALGLVLYATFLGVPFSGVWRAFADIRFLSAITVVNFLLVPLVVWALSRIVAHDQALLVGVLFVLLTPCVDYVIAFTGIAGGAKNRLLAATPLLMLAQMLLLPVYLRLFLGSEFVRSVDLTPFVEAFALLIVLPLAAAGTTQLLAARTRWGAALQRAVLGSMVPLMMIALAVIVISQVAAVGARLTALLLVVPVYTAFAAAMVPISSAVARIARLDAPASRAAVFSGVTRNSLVVLPLVLALPAEFELSPLVVVTQTLVELVLMLVMVRVVPKLIPLREGRDLVR